MPLGLTYSGREFSAAPAAGSNGQNGSLSPLSPSVAQSLSRSVPQSLFFYILHPLARKLCTMAYGHASMLKTIKFVSKSIKKATFSVKKASKRRAFRHAHLNILGGSPPLALAPGPFSPVQRAKKARFGALRSSFKSYPQFPQGRPPAKVAAPWAYLLPPFLSVAQKPPAPKRNSKMPARRPGGWGRAVQQETTVRPKTLATAEGGFNRRRVAKNLSRQRPTIRALGAKCQGQ